MGRILVVIGGLLVVLVAVAISVAIYEDGVREEKKAEAAMFHIAPAQVDRITIDSRDGSRARLVRVDGRWILPDLNGFPADAERVETLLHRLLAVDREQPAGSGAEVLQDLHLADDGFERRITLSRGDKKLAGVVIGKARGPRHVYLRRADEEAAYTGDFGLFDAVPDAAEWIDRGALKLAQGRISIIDVGGLRMAAPPGDAATGWALTDDAASGELKPEAAAHLAELLAELEIRSVLVQAGTAGADDGSPVLGLSLALDDGTEIAYTLRLPAGTDDFALRVSNRPETFLLSPYTAHQLISAARRSSLLEPPSGTSHHAASGAASATPAVTSRHN